MPSPSSHDRKQLLVRKRGLPELNDLLVACGEHLLLTSLFSAAAALTFAIVAWMLIPPVHHADGLVRVREKQSVIFAPQTSRSEDTAFFRTQTKLVQSPQVLQAAIMDAEATPFLDLIPREDRVKWLAKQLSVVTQPGSEVMCITVKHEVPAVAQALCNATTRSYIDEITERLTQDRLIREQQLEIAAKNADVELDLAWNKLRNLAIDVGSDNAATMTLRDEMQFQAYREQSRRLHAAELQGNQLRARLAEMRSNHHTKTDDHQKSVEFLLQQEPQVVQARKRVAEIELQIQQIDQIAANPDSPQLSRLVVQRDYYAAELKSLVDRFRSEFAREVRQKSSSQRTSSIEGLQQQVELNQIEIDFLRKQLDDYDPDVTEIATKTAVPLDMSRHEIRRLSGLADSLWKALQELRIEANSQPRVTLISLASLPRTANRSSQYRGAAFAGMGGWVLVMFCVGYLEWRDCRVRRPEDIQSVSAYPLFGVATSPSTIDHGQTGWKQKISQAFGFGADQASNGSREAATRLVLRDLNSAGTPALMVSSCIAADPRHLISQEIAVLLAGFQRTVLLIDCDTDRGMLSKTLGAVKSIGIRQMPRIDDTPAYEAVSQILLATDHQAIDFLPIGPTDDRQWWVDPRSLHGVIDVMRDRYDVIVINGPSMMGSAESVLLAAEADHCVFSAFANKSRWDQLLRCEETAQSVGVSLSGCIYHSGKSLSRLKLGNNPPAIRKPKPSRRPDPAVTSTTAPAIANPAKANIDEQSIDSSAENELRRQISDLQNEIRRVQSDQKNRTLAGPSSNSNSQPNTAET